MTDTDDERLMTLLSNAPPDEPQGDHVDDGKLIGYRDGRLDEEEAATVEAHLATCRDCRELLDELAAPIDEALLDRARQAARPRERRWWGPAFGALALAAAVVVGFLLPRGAALPHYDLEGPFGGLSEVRGAAPAKDIFVPTSRVKVILRPAEPTDDVSLSVFVVEHDGTLRSPSMVGVTRGTGGGFRMEYVASDLFERTFGERKLLLVVSDDRVEVREPVTMDELRRRFSSAQWFEVTLDYREVGVSE